MADDNTVLPTCIFNNINKKRKNRKRSVWLKPMREDPEEDLICHCILIKTYEIKTKYPARGCKFLF